MTIRGILAAAAATTLFAGVAWGQDSKTRERPSRPAQPATPATPAEPAKPQGQPGDAEMEAAWMAAMTPGEHHQKLAPMIGEWDAAARFWMDPEGQPMEGTGTAKMQWVLGNRYVRQDFNGTFMGMPFEGIGHTGYDNVKKKYVGTWMDSMSTSIMYEEGEYDAGSGLITMRSTYLDPMGREIKGRSTVKLDGADTMVFTMYSTEPGKPEFKAGEITYTRKGAGGAPTTPSRPATPATPASPATPRPGNNPNRGGGGGGN
jgi:hypothetical protein